MIYLKKNVSNLFGLRLSENSTLSNPNYLFEFTADQGEDPTPIYFQSEDISLHKDRLNIFQLVEGEGEGQINFQRGQYTFRVYESETVTLEVSETTEIVIESGRMTVETSRDEGRETGTDSIQNVYE